MEDKQDYVDDLKTIKKIMEESSRFLSLSGLSGIFAGLAALMGSAYAFLIISKNTIDGSIFLFNNVLGPNINQIKIHLSVDALLVLIIAIAVAFYFSYRKSSRKNQNIWSPVSKRLLINLSIPVLAGGIFIIILYFRGQWGYIIPSMLVFYGLGLVNGSKFTYDEIFYLGLFQIISGLVSAALPEYGLLFWALGFGFMHVCYGYFMYRKYEA